MSLVVTVKDKNTGKIWMGADRQLTVSENTKINLGENQPKIFPISNINGVYMGSIGNLRDSQILMTANYKELENALLRGEFNLSYCINEFYDFIYNTLKDKNRIAHDEFGGYSPCIQNEVIVAVGSDAFFIANQGFVLPIDDYLVMGSGCDVATGVLENNKNKSPKVRIKEAIMASARTTLFVNDSIDIVHT